MSMKKVKWKRFMCAALLGSSMIFSNVVEAGVVTDRLPMTCYADHRVLTYNSPGASSSSGYISANVDLIQITQVRADGWCYGSYPGKNKRVSRWFRITDVCADPNYANRGANMRGAQKVYRTAGNNATIGSVSNSESVIVLADNGNRAQIVYRLDNGAGYKMGWVPSSSVQAAAQSHNPEGNFDGLSSNNPNQITVTGWAADRDNMGASLQIHVYVGGGAGSGAESYAITANKSRPDVHNWFVNQGIHAGEFYGFSETINVKRTGNQSVYVYAINVGGGNNIELGHKTVNIKSNSYTRGDINGDGKIDQRDAELCEAMLLGTVAYHPAADVNGDGKLTVLDVSALDLMIKNNRSMPGKEGWIKTNGANVFFRSGASTGTSAIGKIANGTHIRVLEHNNPNGWSRVNYNGSTGYVASQYVIFVPPVPPDDITTKINQKMQQLAANTNGYKNGTKYTGSGQCRGFANKVYLAIFPGVQYISGYANSNYSASAFTGSHEVGRLFNFGSGALGEVKALFTKARPGAFVQMGRRNRMNSTGTAPGPHTAILYSVSDSGVQFYEANADGKNTIKVNSYNWADLANRNKGFTIYEPDNYSLK